MKELTDRQLREAAQREQELKTKALIDAVQADPRVRILQERVADAWCEIIPDHQTAVGYAALGAAIGFVVGQVCAPAGIEVAQAVAQSLSASVAGGFSVATQKRAANSSIQVVK